MNARSFLASHRLAVTGLILLAGSLGLLMLWVQTEEARGVSFNRHFALWVVTVILSIAPFPNIIPQCAAMPCRSIATMIFVFAVDDAIQLTDKVVRYNKLDDIYAPNVVKVGCILVVAASTVMLAFSYLVPAGYYATGNATNHHSWCEVRSGGYNFHWCARDLCGAVRYLGSSQQHPRDSRSGDD